MKSLSLSLALLIALLATPLWAQKGGKAARATGPALGPLKDRTPAEALEAFLAKENDQGRAQWTALCFELGRPGNEDLCREACTAMAAKIGDKTPLSARLFLIRQLQWIGRAESLDALTAAVGDEDQRVRNAAICAMQQIPLPAANARLLSALAAAKTPATKVALCNALAARADASSAEALAKAVGDADQSVVAAAAYALGKIGGAGGAKALEGALAKTSGNAHRAVADAYLLCGDSLLQAGKLSEARAIYQALGKSSEPKPVRLAALRGSLRAAGDGAAKLAIEILGGEDADARRIAAAEVGDLNVPALRQLAASLGKLDPNVRTVVLASLAAKKDKASLPAVLAAARQNEPTVKAAAVRALAGVGDASVLPQLFAALADKSVAPAARQTLVELQAEGVDAGILTRLKGSKDPDEQTTLIDVLEARGARLATPTLLQLATGDDEALRGRAFAAAATLIETKDLPALGQALLKAARGAQRDAAEKALAAASGRLQPSAPAASALAAYKAGSAEEKLALLPAIGRIGSEPALLAVKAALASSNPEVLETGVRALCNWPDASVADELLEVAREGKDPNHRLWALRALIRVIALPSERTNAERLKTLEVAMKLATREDERRLILERAASIRDPETLKLLVPQLANPDLAEAACKAICDLAHHRDLREPNAEVFHPALDKVLATTKDESLRERAKKYRDGKR